MNCGYCNLDVPDGAVKCGHCGEYLAGQSCPDCLATVPEGAKVCRYCGGRFKKRRAGSADIALDMNARLIPTIFMRMRLLPQEIVADNEKIVIKTPGLFRLWENADEIPWNKIAGFTYRDGIIWDRVEIETRGQNPSTVLGIAKEDGSQLREILQNLEK